MTLETIMETASNSGFLAVVAGLVGLDPASFLYFITLLLCYPLCYISRTYLHGQAQSTKHVYFVLCGLTLASMNFGYDIIHTAISVLVNYVLLVAVGGSQLSVALSFAFNMGYLVTGYILISTDGYDVMWTTPHCILTLRMIGTAYDLYDGHRDEIQLSPEQKQLSIKTPPTLLEMCGYTYFPGGFFAGPQFSIRRYLDFTAEKLLDNDKGERPNCIVPALNRLGVGAVYAILECILAPMFSSAFLLSEEFSNSSLLYQIIMVAIWGKVVFFKYCTVFLIVDGACIMSGLSYNGKDKKGNALWDACCNVIPSKLETSTITASCIRSFNITTNVWVSRYVFKRLKFLNNRYISQTAAVMFLAVWHGLYIGYYICFALEIFVTTTETFVQDAVKRYPPLTKLVSNPVLKLPIFVLLKITVCLSVGYPLVSFVLLRWRRIRLVYSAMYHIPTLVVIVFPVLYQLVILPRLKKMERRAAKKAAEAVQDTENNENEKSK